MNHLLQLPRWAGDTSSLDVDPWAAEPSAGERPWGSGLEGGRGSQPDPFCPRLQPGFCLPHWELPTGANAAPFLPPMLISREASPPDLGERCAGQVKTSSEA